MDLSKVRQKLQSFQKPAPREKIDYTKVYFKPKPGKYQIRIVPSKFDKTTPFKEVYFHYGFAKFPMLALTNWGEKDPIVELSQQLRKSKDPENWKLAKKIEPKMRIFVPVVVRGQEQEGVRLWEFGKETYQQLLGIAADEDYGDYTNEISGRDFTIDVVEDVVAGRKINKISSIRIKPKESTITSDPELLTKILSEQPDVLTLNRKPSFEDLSETLKKWMGEAEETKEEDELPFDNDEEEDADAPPVAATSGSKKSNVDKFDAAFK